MASTVLEESETKVLHINPLVLYFPPPLNRIITNILKLQNTSKDHYVSYKVKTTRPNRYCVRPNIGLIPPGEAIELQIHYSFQKDPPTSLRSKDKFQVESILLTAPIGPDQSLPDLFKSTPKEKIMKEKLKCRFASPTPTVSERAVKERGQDMKEVKPDASFVKAEGNTSKEAKALQEVKMITKERDSLRNKIRELQSQQPSTGGLPFLSSNSLIGLLLALLLGYLFGSFQWFSVVVLVSIALVALLMVRLGVFGS